MRTLHQVARAAVLTLAAVVAASTMPRSLSSSTSGATNAVLSTLDAVSNSIDTKLFLYQTPGYQWIPSTVYRVDDFKESLIVMANEGVAGKTFYTGEEDVENGHVFGLVNIAAFLAQSMKETIKYDACDENSWDFVGGKYPLSNACGQLGQSYQDYHCPDHEKHMECPVDPSMSITAVTHAKWYGAPGPLFCGPKTEERPFSGFWDHVYECNKKWANPPESCDVYEGQKAGRYDHSTPYANTAGRTDVEGCCWWGRGVIQTSGVCNFGKLNYYLGAGAKKDGREARYPEVDFCKDPEVICSNPEYKELKWVAGELYWMESVQPYIKGGWDYLTELHKFVEGGMVDDSFIDAVSGIVNRGCHDPPCGTGPVDGGYERSQNFKKILDVFFGDSPPKVGPSPITSHGSPTDFGSSTGSGSSEVSVTLDRFYPDYNSNWAVGKCVNTAPLPSGRPAFDTGKECCDISYGNQASGVCLSSLPGGQEPPPPESNTPNVFDGGSPPDVGPSPITSLGSQTDFGPSTESGSSEVSVTLDKFYPDYNSNWAVGKCVNTPPLPSGRPAFDTGKECCDKSYGNQVSGACLSSLPGGQDPPPPETESGSSEVSVTLDKFYPDYNSNWAVGKCVNTPPIPSGRPSFDTGKECCDKSYGNQASGACLSSLPGGQDPPPPESNTPPSSGSGPSNPEPAPSPVITVPDPAPFPPASPPKNSDPTESGEVGPGTEVESGEASDTLDKWYPDYNPLWALGKCVNLAPLPGGRPVYDSGTECCDTAYRGQATGACHGSLPGTDATGSLDRWYPDYNPLWSLGKCLNEAPLPYGRPTYTTGSECCQKAYGGQASGECLNSLAQPFVTILERTNGMVPGTSMANAFSTNMAIHARQRTNFISYNCGSDTEDFPMNSMIVDILFDYEISVAKNLRPEHVLPELKKDIMDELANSLGCMSSEARNLQEVSIGGVLLGFHYSEGSDVIDGEKGSCSKSADVNATCIPVIGYLAAIIQHDSSVQEALATKDIILDEIQHAMASSSHPSTQGIIYVSDHNEDQLKHQPSDKVAASSHEPNNTTSIIVGVVLVVVALGVLAALFLKQKQRRKAKEAESEGNKDDGPVLALNNSTNDSNSDEVLDPEKMIGGGFEGSESPQVEFGVALSEHPNGSDQRQAPWTINDQVNLTNDSTEQPSCLFDDQQIGFTQGQNGGEDTPGPDANISNDDIGPMVDHFDVAPANDADNGGVNFVLVGDSSEMDDTANNNAQKYAEEPAEEVVPTGDDKGVQEIVAMGFSEASARKALANTSGDVQLAVSILLSEASELC